MNNSPWREAEIQFIRFGHPTKTISSITGRSEAAIRGKRQRLAARAAYLALPGPPGKPGSLQGEPGPGGVLGPQIKKETKEKMNRPWTDKEIINLRNLNWTTQELASITGRSEAAIRGKRQRLGLIIPAAPAPSPAPEDPLKKAAKEVPIEFGRIPLDLIDGDKWTRIGLVADTHLCCREERLDALNAQYDLFEREGITSIFHAGNIVDGFCARINGASAYESSVDGQATYCAKHYPSRPGIITHFITGNDHDFAWNGGKEGFNGGAYLQMVCEAHGRSDLKYIGHVEADVELRCGEHVQIMKIQHPGGGSAYARSYKGQKMVESMQGGEKPAILCQGHYHVSGYSFDRNVHILGLPGFQEQTVFGRTKHLRYEVGGVILEFKMSSVTGAITRVRPDFNMFFDRGFYKKFIPSDGLLRSPTVVVQTGK